MPDGHTSDQSAHLDLQSRVPAAANGLALVDYLVQRFRYHSRAQWREVIDAGQVAVNGRTAAPGQPVATGAIVRYRKLHAEPTVDRDIRICHVDAAILVLEKPAQLPMHADGPFVRHTLIHLLRTELGHPEAHIVHRLDRETSGLVVVARTIAARRCLEQQFAAGAVQKSYLAVVRGRVDGAFRCDAAIGHSSTSCITLRRSAAPTARAAKAASTSFELVERGPLRSLLRVRPTTGRTHQIRVHLEHCGHPLVGDKLYGRPDEDYLAFVHRMKAGGDPRQTPTGEPPRQLLHASDLRFTHPDSDALLHFDSPPPAEFRDWLHAES